MDNDNRAPIPMASVDEHKPVGALIGSIIIIAILILACVYLWTTRIQPRIEQKDQPATGTTADSLLNTPDTATKALGKQGTSDNIADIEKDLKSTNLNNLDKEVQAL